MKQTWAKDDIAENPQEPHQKFIKLRKTIRYWERDKVGNLVKQKKACNKIFQWMDRSSERRPLTQLELLMRKSISKRLATIVKLEETMWRQRAKINWLN
jgi:hypothetical protein